MNHIAAVLGLLLAIAGACSPTLTPAAPTSGAVGTASGQGEPTATPLVSGTTSAPSLTATPSPPSSEAVRTYLRRVHGDVLLDYARCVEGNRALLAQAWNQGDDPSVLCASTDEGYWLHFDALWLMLSSTRAPPEMATFHTTLLEALSDAEKSSRAYNWFCQTYHAFGQPADGMWTRLAVEVRACVTRMIEVRELWALLGGTAMGLQW